jgi:hypothetical protein
MKGTISVILALLLICWTIDVQSSNSTDDILAALSDCELGALVRQFMASDSKEDQNDNKDKDIKSDDKKHGHRQIDENASHSSGRAHHSSVRKSDRSKLIDLLSKRPKDTPNSRLDQATDDCIVKCMFEKDDRQCFLDCMSSAELSE